MRSTVAEYGRQPASRAGGRVARERPDSAAGPSVAEAVPGLMHRTGPTPGEGQPVDALGGPRLDRAAAGSLARLRDTDRPLPDDAGRSTGDAAGAESALPALRQRTAPDRTGGSDRRPADRTSAPGVLRALSPVPVSRVPVPPGPVPSAAVIHREYEPTQAQEQDFGEIDRKWPDADPEGARALAVKWCSTHAQFLSLVNNFSWPEFRALAKKYPTGSAVPVKAAAIRAKMQKEMQAELQQIAAAKAAAWTAQVDHYRQTGAPGPSMNYDLFLQKSLLKVAHHSTFRTLDEKSQKGPNGSGPYTRSFSASVGGQPALWEIHVHYAGNGTAQKAHAKLIKDRHSKDHVADLKLASKVIGETTGKIDGAIDTKERARADW